MIICSTRSSVINRGRPGRGSSERPSSRSIRNRDRHLETMSRETPRFAAACPIGPPSAAPQHNPCSRRQRCLPPPASAQQNLPLLLRQHDRDNLRARPTTPYQLQSN